MRPPTDQEIENEVYTGTMQETGPEIDGFIKGMKHMRDKWVESLTRNLVQSDEWIYERDGSTVYRRHFGADPSTREVVNG
jgi:hypothetical protein